MQTEASEASEEEIDPVSVGGGKNATMSVSCPFARLSVNDDAAERPAVRSDRKSEKDCCAQPVRQVVAIPKQSADQLSDAHKNEIEQVTEEASVAPKCPLGYDSGSFKIGPFSCVICRALLYDSSRCVPCQHVFCRVCISRFQDCVVCGADINGIDSDPKLQDLVDRFIEGHGKIKRPPIRADEGIYPAVEGLSGGVVSYEDVSMARGTFLIQQAMRAFQAQNFESAKSRLLSCAEDTREELLRSGSSSEICSQLGAVLGMLGDCCRSMGNFEGSMAYFEESVGFLSELSPKDAEVMHTLSVTLNKLGDLKYYAGDLEAALAFYSRALKLRQQSTDLVNLSSQALDVAVSFAKVADVTRALGKCTQATEGFQEAVKFLEGLSSNKTKEGSQLEIRRLSFLEFLRSQLTAENVGNLE